MTNTHDTHDDDPVELRLRARVLREAADAAEAAADAADAADVVDAGAVDAGAVDEPADAGAPRLVLGGGALIYAVDDAPVRRLLPGYTALVNSLIAEGSMPALPKDYVGILNRASRARIAELLLAADDADDAQD